MFRTGKTSQQKSLFDQELSFSPTMQKMLQNSWVGNFFETIFLAIREERFSVMYSEKIGIEDIEKERICINVEVRDKEKKVGLILHYSEHILKF